MGGGEREEEEVDRHGDGQEEKEELGEIVPIRRFPCSDSITLDSAPAVR